MQEARSRMFAERASLVASLDLLCARKLSNLALAHQGWGLESP